MRRLFPKCVFFFWKLKNPLSSFSKNVSRGRRTAGGHTHTHTHTQRSTPVITPNSLLCYSYMFKGKPLIGVRGRQHDGHSVLPGGFYTRLWDTLPYASQVGFSFLRWCFTDRKGPKLPCLQRSSACLSFSPCLPCVPRFRINSFALTLRPVARLGVRVHLLASNVANKCVQWAGVCPCFCFEEVWMWTVAWMEKMMKKGKGILWN